MNEYKIERLYEDTALTDFSSSNDDLNDFLISGAKLYEKGLLATTYLVYSGADIAGYFSLMNDSIRMDIEDKSAWNKLNRLIHNSKRRKSYPAVKIGRLAVASKYEHSGIGRHILNSIISIYSYRVHYAGCRFITVDALASATGFYEKSGFKYLSSKDARAKTRFMYLDILPYIED